MEKMKVFDLSSLIDLKEGDEQVKVLIGSPGKGRSILVDEIESIGKLPRKRKKAAKKRVKQYFDMMSKHRS